MVQANPVRHARSPRYIGLRMSADDYRALADDGFKYQIINGVVVMSPSPTPRHQSVLTEIIAQMQFFLRQEPVARVFPDIDVRFAPDLLYRPDLVVIRSERLPKPLRRIDLTPDLIVEILSPGSESMDERTKLADYERFGVREYWIVSPEPSVSVRVMRLVDGRFVQAPAAGDEVASTVLDGFKLDLRGVREAAAD